ncbi:unnamed protein product [Strongylus vulgaris]|uniref:Uncharacterized protein n=1 Tax=Strongylus vulgaris TaxID=40348 RepID=A0A3P7I8D9_STRVU|nr:unnamed protein product [Strongylus vulgaris]
MMTKTQSPSNHTKCKYKPLMMRVQQTLFLKPWKVIPEKVFPAVSLPASELSAKTAPQQHSHGILWIQRLRMETSLDIRLPTGMMKSKVKKRKKRSRPMRLRQGSDLKDHSETNELLKAEEKRLCLARKPPLELSQI